MLKNQKSFEFKRHFRNKFGISVDTGTADVDGIS